ncbi:MAG: response regulator [Eubacteriales bacterium]|nr:response regulator [Eubacteriales bacterium]
MSIIIVEDEPVILRSVKRGIEQLGDGFQVVAQAYDGIEALEKIKTFCPDIVISDIVMPQMDGLEMIEAAKKQGTQARFILLSGYGEFKYAQKALDMGVVRYLLKPVDFQELGELLEDLKKDILKDRQQMLKENIRNLINGSRDEKSLHSEIYYMAVIAVWGTMGRSGFYEIHPAADIIRETDFGFLSDMEEKWGKHIFCYPGHYANSYLFMIPGAVPHWNHISDAAEEMWLHLQSKECFLTVCYSRKGVRGDGIYSMLREMYCEIPVKLIFGKNTITDYPCEKMLKMIPAHEGVGRLSDDICASMNKEHLRKVIKGWCSCWEKNQISQAELQTQLREIFESPVLNQRNDAMEFLYQSYTYAELEEQLFLELSPVLCPVKGKASLRGENLAESVKKYLDIHFAEEISYKEFNRIFGYSDKYITAVFKEKTGITPSRYVLERKMDLAKQLLMTDSGLLLREVAQRVGYTDQLYFSKVFKNCTGMSPSAYMKNRKDKDNDYQ